MRTSGSILPRESSESEIPARFAHRLLWPSHDTAKRKGPHRQTRMRVLHRDPKTGEIKVRVEKPLAAFLSLDDEAALIAQLRQYGVRELSTVRAPGHGKMFPSGDARTAFFDDILVQLWATEVGEALVLVGPGFTREAFVEYLKARDPPLAAKVHVHGTAHAGMQGIQEALRAGVGAKVFGESRVGYETQLVEKLLEAIATDRPVAYGPAEVQESADA